MTVRKVLMIDPSNGWAYGFPKPLPKDVRVEDIKKWFISEGLPEELTKYPYRVWEEEINNDD